MIIQTLHFVAAGSGKTLLGLSAVTIQKNYSIQHNECGGFLYSDGDGETVGNVWICDKCEKIVLRKMNEILPSRE